MAANPGGTAGWSGFFAAAKGRPRTRRKLGPYSTAPLAHPFSCSAKIVDFLFDIAELPEYIGETIGQSNFAKIQRR